MKAFRMRKRLRPSWTPHHTIYGRMLETIK